MPKRGRNEPKAKGPRTAPPPISNFKNLSIEYFSIDILLCSKGGESSISNDISKPF
jgi:hypothetical protein